MHTGALRVTAVLPALVLLVTVDVVEPRWAASQDAGGVVTATPAVPRTLRRLDARQLAPPVALSKTQRQTMHRNVLQRRERAASQVDPNPPGPPGLPTPRVRETRVLRDGAEFHGTPSELLVGHNVQNPIASDGSQSTVAEVSAVNDGVHVFYAGNWYTSYATDASTFTEVAIPGGTVDAPFFCCDIDVVYDAARGVTIWSGLYCADVSCDTEGDVIVRVKNSIPGGISCSYSLDYPSFSEFPDFPHLGLSNKFGYVSANVFDASGWAGADMWRLDLDAVADCSASPSALLFSYFGPSGAQRVFVPATNAQHAMYWATLENATQVRLFKWPETSTSVQQSLKTVAASTFPSPGTVDCRGGTGNLNVFSTTLDVRIIGFDTRTAVAGPLVGVWWSVGPDASHPNVYVRAAIFQEPGLNLIGQPDIWNSAYCMNYPAVTGSERDGHYGLAIAFGGKTGGGGAAVSAGVAVDDDYTTGIGTFSTIQSSVTGTHNPADGRYGDYLTVTRHRPCGLWFAATNYALVGGNDDSNVNARYVEFGRRRDAGCYYGWRDKVRDPVPP